MKCPNCGDTERQQRIGPTNDGQGGWRCAKCGRLYPGPDLAEILRRLDQMKTEAAELTRRGQSLLTQIAETEAQLHFAHAQPENGRRRLRRD